MALLCQEQDLWKSVPLWEAAPEWDFTNSQGTMLTTFSTGLGCVLAHSAGERVLGLSTIPEFKLLALVGGALIVLATLVRHLYPVGGSAAPKSMQMVVWISPPEIAEQMSRRETV